MLVLILLAGIALPSFALVAQRGSDYTHDIATWNLENFPLAGGPTVNYLTLMIRDLELDLIGVQEIASVTDFNTLVSNLNGWDGVLSPHQYGNGTYQKTGLLYDSDKVEAGELVELFEDDWWEFPRPPIQVPITMVELGDTLEFNIIVLHLKAYDDQENRERREGAIIMLKDYIDGQIEEGNTKWMVVGDFNDELQDPEEYNIFMPMINDAQQYVFLTEPICDYYRYDTYIGGNNTSFIDHIIVTADLMAEYQGGDTETLLLDGEVNNYVNVISDHRPVASYFPGAVNAVRDRSEGNLPGEMNLSVWPVPTNGAVNASFNLPQGQTGHLTILNIMGQVIETQQLGSQNGVLNWSPQVSTSGIYLIQLKTETQSLYKKAIIVK